MSSIFLCDSRIFDISTQILHYSCHSTIREFRHLFGSIIYVVVRKICVFFFFFLFFFWFFETTEQTERYLATDAAPDYIGIKRCAIEASRRSVAYHIRLFESDGKA